MRTVVLSILSAFIATLSNTSIGAAGNVDFTDYNDVGLQLYDAVVKPTGSDYKLTGILANSQMKLAAVDPTLLIVAQDCSYSDDGSGVCVEIGRQYMTIPRSLPPRTTAALDLVLHFKESPFKLTGVLEWSVWALGAERPQSPPNPSLERP